MNKVKRYKPQIAVACVLLLVLFPLAALGQGRSRSLKIKKATQEEKWQKKFTDSLSAYRDSIYSDSVRVEPLPEMETAPFFLPMTFYKGVAHNAFSLDKRLSDSDRKLLNIYLNHPELVKNTQGTAAPTVTFSFTTKAKVQPPVTAIPSEPVTASTDAARKLYAYMYSLYGKKERHGQRQLEQRLCREGL